MVAALVVEQLVAVVDTLVVQVVDTVAVVQFEPVVEELAVDTVVELRKDHTVVPVELLVEPVCTSGLLPCFLQILGIQQ